jgi:hypothetical protein
MTARLDYLVKSKNRCVVAYSSDGGGGNVNFDIGPSAFCSNITDFTSACLSRVIGSAGGNGGTVEIAFAGSAPHQAFQVPFASVVDANFERFTIQNLSTGSTGMATITNRLSSGATASIVMEFVTRHV